jgi:hypothetical protein
LNLHGATAAFLIDRMAAVISNFLIASLSERLDQIAALHFALCRPFYITYFA